MEVDLFISKASDKQLLLESVERGIDYQDMREPAKHANSGYRIYFPRGKPKSGRPRNSKLLEAGYFCDFPWVQILSRCDGHGRTVSGVSFMILFSAVCLMLTTWRHTLRPNQGS